MRTHVVIGLSAILAAGAGLSSGSAGAQQKSLKDQLIGTWTLVSWENTAANGTKRQLANPKGIFILDAGGRYAEVWERGDFQERQSTNDRGTCGRNAGLFRRELWHMVSQRG
jgi:hypothetical protein